MALIKSPHVSFMAAVHSGAEARHAIDHEQDIALVLLGNDTTQDVHRLLQDVADHADAYPDEDLNETLCARRAKGAWLDAVGSLFARHPKIRLSNLKGEGIQQPWHADTDVMAVISSGATTEILGARLFTREEWIKLKYQPDTSERYDAFSPVPGQAVVLIERSAGFLKPKKGVVHRAPSSTSLSRVSLVATR